jgi:hypothetical protein
MTDTALSAIITGGFGVVIAAIGLLAKANKRDHDTNTAKLDRLIESVKNLRHGHDRIETKLDTHIRDHAKGDV